MQMPSKPITGRLASWLFVATLACPLALLAGLSVAQEQPAGGKSDTAGARFKNIQILKDIPAEKLIPIMHNWNTALGVKCDYCHVIGPDHSGFEKDDKPQKATARKMLLFAIDLNKNRKSVKGKVTCYMCHRGKHEPEGAPGSETEPKKE